MTNEEISKLNEVERKLYRLAAELEGTAAVGLRSDLAAESMRHRGREARSLAYDLQELRTGKKVSYW